MVLPTSLWVVFKTDINFASVILTPQSWTEYSTDTYILYILILCRMCTICPMTWFNFNKEILPEASFATNKNTKNNAHGSLSYPIHFGVVRNLSNCAHFVAMRARFAGMCAHFAGFHLWPKKTSMFNQHHEKMLVFIKNMKKCSFHPNTLQNSNKCSCPWFARKNRCYDWMFRLRFFISAGRLRT